MKQAVLVASLLLGLWAHGQSVTNGNFRAAKGPAAPSVAAVSAVKPRVKDAPEKKVEKVKTYPYHGYLDSVAADGSWIRLKGKTKTREIVLSKDTTVSRDGTFIAVADLAAGKRVTGTVFRNAEGREEARTVRIKSPE